MSKEDKQVKVDVSTPKGAAKVMVKTLASTTVRIFAPVTILFLIGLTIDLNAGTKPYGMAIGTGVGIIIAVFLVVRQLKAIREDNKIITQKEAKA